MFSSVAPNTAAAAAGEAAREGRERGMREDMHRNTERGEERGRQRGGGGKESRRERDFCRRRCEQAALLSEVFLLEDGGIAEGM